MGDNTTIPVRKETQRLLREVGTEGQSYDEIILDLLEMREAFIADLLDKFEYMEEHPKEGVSLEEYAEKRGIRPGEE